MHEGLGDHLRRALAAADHAHIVAPFMQAGPVRRLLEPLPSETPVTLVTRWKLADVARGVSDLAVLDIAEGRSGTELLLCDRLHAKYFRAGGKQVWLGSANLTGAGLGWSEPCNLELLVNLPFDDELRQFEQTLLTECYPATHEIAEALREAVASMSPQYRASFESSSATRLTWTPHTRNPPDLLKAYCGTVDVLTRASQEATSQDLRFLQIPAGLQEPAFRSCVRARLLTAGVVRYVDDFVVRSQRFGAVRDHLRYYPPLMDTEFDASYTWQTLFRWLMFFLPDRYEAWTANYSEIIRRKST